MELFVINISVNGDHTGAVGPFLSEEAATQFAEEYITHWPYVGKPTCHVTALMPASQATAGAKDGVGLPELLRDVLQGASEEDRLDLLHKATEGFCIHVFGCGADDPEKCECRPPEVR